MLLLFAACVAEVSDDTREVGGVGQALGPSPDLGCTFLNSGGRDYWFCAMLRSWQSARGQCQAIGLDLTAIGSATENQLIASHVLISSWIGATDSASEGAWRWADTGTQFWQGAAGGSPVGGAYRNWQLFEPNNLFNQDCGTTSALGLWTDESCGTLRPYVCEGVVDLCPADPNKTLPGQCGCGAADTDGDGDGTADCVDGCPVDAGKTAPGQCGCGNADTDTDGDQIADCADTCAGDPNKVTPGVCGCGVSDGDGDSDGSPDCDDLCPNDRKRTVPGDCGCADAAMPAGTACGDGLCAANTQCDGAGSCGNAWQCNVPDTFCTFGMRGDVAYWFCDNDRGFDDARQRCQAVGMDLAMIETAGEDQFITERIHEHTFIGASDRDVEGDFGWVHTGEVFWQGGANGQAVSGAYTNWEAGQPSDGLFGSQDCVVKDPPLGGGKWETRNCDGHDAYACERIDLCPDDATKLEPGVCGCGLPEIDTDTDGTFDCDDECPWDPARTDPGDDGCASPTCQAPLDVLTPIFECVLTRPDGSKAAAFSVHNASPCFVQAAIGADNAMVPAPEFRGQPTLFEPGRQYAVAVELTAGPVSWSLAGKTAVASESGPPCEDVVEQLDAPVDLAASYNHITNQRYDAQVESAVPTPFVIPERLPVAAGLAANGQAELLFHDASAGDVTCYYRGMSAGPEPLDDLDVARGDAFVFESCSNGALAGATASATRWELRVLGGDARLGVTGVKLGLGEGCSGLPPMLSAEQSVALRDGFDWSSTTAVAETTIERGMTTPLPALYYALIYVQTGEQLQLLQDSGVFFRQLPLFPSELDRYKGKCGTVSVSGDLRGYFVFSLLPGTVYNHLRSLALQPGGQAPFRAVVLRQVPDAPLRNPDGTVSWQRLVDAGFWYFPPDEVQALAAAASGTNAGTISTLLHDAWGSVTQILCPYIDRGCYFAVDVRLHLSVLNRDPLFVRRSVMKRGWGPEKNVYPHGIDVEVMTWQSGGPGFGHGKLSRNGNVTVKVPMESTVEGSGLCLHLSNDAGRFLDGKHVVMNCDFRNLAKVFGRFMHDIPRRTSDSSPTRVTVLTEDANTYLLSQVTDGADYMKYVGRTPIEREADVSVGLIANLIGYFQEPSARAFTPCLSYPSMKTLVEDSVTAAIKRETGEVGGAILVGLMDFFTGNAVGNVGENPLMRRDIFLPASLRSSFFPEPSGYDDRATMTHEYGHFVMCDALNAAGGLRPLYERRVIDEGFAEEKTSYVGIAMESFADFFSAQVAGGISYPNPQIGTIAYPIGRRDYYCRDRTCMEKNYYGQPEHSVAALTKPYSSQIARYMTAVHDAFDRVAPWRGAGSGYVPTDANPWVVSEGTYLTSGGGYAAWYWPAAVDDDSIQLPGSAIRSWLVEQASNTAYYPFGAQRALARVMRQDPDNTWCDVCELFAAHDNDYRTGNGPWTRHSVWEACLHGELAEIVEAPSHYSLRLNRDGCVPCGPGEYSNADGVCVGCNAANRETVVWNECQQCAPGWVADPAGDHCNPCASNEYTLGNTCVPCEYPKQPNAERTGCVACPMDAVLDAATFSQSACGEGYFDIHTNTGAGDACPDAFWLEIQNVDALAAGAPNASELRIDAYRFMDGATCGNWESSMFVSVNADEQDLVPAVEFEYFYSTVLGIPCTQYGTTGCPNECEYIHSPVRSFPADELAARDLRRLRVQIRLYQEPGTRTDVFVHAPGLCTGTW